MNKRKRISNTLGLYKKRSKTPGLPPGSLIFTGEARSEPVTISVIDYTESLFEEHTEASLADCEQFVKPHTTTWINVNGIHDVATIESIGKLVDLHDLILEDLLNLNQRPKIEEYDAHLFIILKMLHYDENRNLTIEQVSLVVGETFVLSFQEFAGDVFEPVRQRLRSGKGRVRNMGPDYLAYALMDTIVDHYFSVIEQIGEDIEDIEQDVLVDPQKEVLIRINNLKREVILLRRSIWPLREVISSIERSETNVFDPKTLLYLRDMYDHTIQVVEVVETFRDLLAGLTDLYMSSLSQKMNEVMKVLTIVGTIFIPLTFIAGVYGMNFERMPELHWTHGYPVVMAGMAGIGIFLLIYFKRKKWL